MLTIRILPHKLSDACVPFRFYILIFFRNSELLKVSGSEIWILKMSSYLLRINHSHHHLQSEYLQFDISEGSSLFFFQFSIDDFQRIRCWLIFTAFAEFWRLTVVYRCQTLIVAAATARSKCFSFTTFRKLDDVETLSKFKFFRLHAKQIVWNLHE